MTVVLKIASLIGLVVSALSLGYLVLPVFAAVSSPRTTAGSQHPSHRFIIAIPAHNEERVIEATIRRMRALNYPANLFSIHIVTDHCSDNTARVARRAGGFVHERNEGPRTGKGAALSWLFQRVLEDADCDAVVVFDADTRVDPDFLRIMDARLDRGDQIIQGQHVISNPDSGSFAALLWAIHLINNRLLNISRSNLGWSAMNMGDSICIRREILQKLGWGGGLADDYQLRYRLLLDGVKIACEPAAIGYGEAPRTWAQAQAQQARWKRGSWDASRQYRRRLLVEGIKRRDPALLDGALEAFLPAYSTLVVISIISLLIQLLVNWQIGPVFSKSLIIAWMGIVGVLLVYPFIGLALEHAPPKAYLALLRGPLFVVWRTWVASIARFGSQPVLWIRTEHEGEGHDNAFAEERM
jgi:cellulose synthase/poly-beta-1,6-N-acetylglucosamine synthase-like glycosyltransferase